MNDALFKVYKIKEKYDDVFMNSELKEDWTNAISSIMKAMAESEIRTLKIEEHGNRNVVEAKLLQLSEEHPWKITLYDYENGWADCIREMLKFTRENDDLILEKSSEIAMTFASDEDRLEDKAAFVRNIGKVAMQTRTGCIGMQLENGGDTVKVNYNRGGFHKVNIHMDSYAAIMRDCSSNIQ
jgi:hypothetical protein